MTININNIRVENRKRSFIEFDPDNGSDHRAGTIILQAEKPTRKPGFACITLLSGDLGEGSFQFQLRFDYKIVLFQDPVFEIFNEV